MSTSAKTAQAASFLLDLWTRRARCAAIPADARPATRTEGYAVQTAMAALQPHAVFGWKIAATSKAGQAHIGVDGPLAGRLFADRVMQNGAEVTLNNNLMLVAEIEFAFRFARPLLPTKDPVPGVSVRPLVNTSKKSFGNTDRAHVEYMAGKSQDGPLTIMATARVNPKVVESAETVMRRIRGEEVEEKAPEVTRKEARIVVVGDSDFATNSFYHILGNGALFLNAVNFLAARENLIGLEPRTYDLPYVNMTNTQMKGTFILSLILIPLLMAALGVVVWWRRR